MQLLNSKKSLEAPQEEKCDSLVSCHWAKDLFAACLLSCQLHSCSAPWKELEMKIDLLCYPGTLPGRKDRCMDNYHRTVNTIDVVKVINVMTAYFKK